ncbi:MAG: N-6 DNA methylase [Candidatus Brocadiae bacterium]|nr:N-6 DNA methylase [Candidatus Brocadiia bacterium]
MAQPFREYIKQVGDALKRADATEHTHRPALKELLEALAPALTATNEPKRVECGAPDFVVSRKPGPVTVGYVECKDVGQSLDKWEEDEQLRRYRRSLENLVLTDYAEFRWYVDGELRATARLGRVGNDGAFRLDKDGPSAVEGLLGDFLAHEAIAISSPKTLAERMARITHMIRDVIVQVFETHNPSHILSDLRKGFARVLIPDLERPEKTAQFADMYAQTITYGLFAARCNHPGGPFTRQAAAAEIPKTNPFLRKLFDVITGVDFGEEPYAPFVEDLVQVLHAADMDGILAEFGTATRRKDPVFHFYETFLATYDRKLREARGVYYTPEPVVSYLVRSVDWLLKDKFGMPLGLADSALIDYERMEEGQKVKGQCHRLLVLDPACGTGTFLYAVVDHIREWFREHNNAGLWSGYVRKHLLPRIFGFELLVAPYAVAHLKLGMQLAAMDLPEEERKEWAYDFSGDERLGIYLTNTLSKPEGISQTLPGPFRIISDEANAAAEIKRDLPIMVVLGNPPYSGHSANKGAWIDNLLKKRYPLAGGARRQSYYEVDGGPLRERNPKWLQDDYVKFIRWAQSRIDHTGAGILAFITNHGYLDNPTFRGMRQSLMETFDEIYIVDLHGSAKKREMCPDGSKDQNVFDIQQGVAICLMVKLP